MCHPGAIMPVVCFSFLVGTNLCERLLVRLLVISDRDLSGHAPHRVNCSPMTGLDAEQRIGAHKMPGHGHQRAICQDELRLISEPFNATEDVITSAAVQPGTMIFQFVE